jgi:hypothetical protein
LAAAVAGVVAAGASEERHWLQAKRVAACERSDTRPPSRQAEQAFLAMIDELFALGHRKVNFGHALLGVLRVDDGIAVKALRESGVNPNAVRDSVLDAIQQPNGGTPDGGPC